MSPAPARSRRTSEIDRQIIALLQAKEKERLAQGRRAGNRDEDHQPVYFEQTQGIHLDVGCSCGHRPKTAGQSVNTMFNSFKAHLRQLGLAPRYQFDPRHSFGPGKGLTWDECQAQGIKP